MTDQVETQVSKTQRKKLLAAEFNAKRSTVEENRSPTLEEQSELEALSKEVFNSASKYKALMLKGEVVPVTVIVTEHIPAVLDADGKEVTPEETKEVQVHEKALGSEKSLKLQTVFHTVESVRALMLERKRQQDHIRTLIAKMQAEKQAEQDKKKLQESVQSQLGGSAV